MTNNDELAIKLKAAAEMALPVIEKYEAGEVDVDDALDMLSDFTDAIRPAKILALLAERDADKKRIAELERDVDAANARVDTKCAQLCNQDEQIEMLSLRIAELEARTVAHDVGVMNIGNPYCEDHLVAWTVTGRQLAAGIYYLDARRVGDIRLEVGE